MKLPSIAQAVTDARTTLLRFPFVILSAAIGTVSALILIEHEQAPGAAFFLKALFAGILGIPLLTGIVLTAEKKKWGPSIKLGVQIAGLILLAVYAMTVPPVIQDVPVMHVIRLLMLAIGLHLFVAVAPFSGRGEVNGFWHFNKSLFLRILTSGIYTFVLWAGLAIALAALDNLFGVNVPPRRYAELWALLTGMFSVWFFLAGVPDDLDSLDSVTDYPKELKIFTQYILFPLVLVYLAILYAYMGKIVVSWNWPQGWVSKLILGFAGTGMFSLLLMHPISTRTENVWIKNASRWFYVALIPLVVMLFFAVWRRVSEYGITEGRYIALIVGVWLGAVIVYTMLSKSKSIKFIPASLCITAFIVSFGPWSVFSVSEQSQIGRLREVLTKNAMLVDGKVQKASTAISFDDRKQISSIIAYLQMFHGLNGIQPWFGESLKLETGGWKFKDPTSVTKMMGVEYTNAWQTGNASFMILTADNKQGVDLTGYDRLIRMRQSSSGVPEKQLEGLELGYRVSSDMSGIMFHLIRDGRRVDSLHVEFGPMVAEMMKERAGGSGEKIAPEKMTIVKETASFKVKMFFSQLNIQRTGEESRINFFDANVLYKVNLHQ